MNLFFHRFWSVVSLVLSIVVVAPAILAVGGLFLFTLAFLDYVPPDMTWWDVVKAPVGILGIGLVTLLLLPASVLFVRARRSLRCSQLDDLMLERVGLVRTKFAEFYDKHGRKPNRGEMELGVDLGITPYGAYPFVVLSGEPDVDPIDGKQIVAATLAPWKSAFGWHSVVLLEDGGARLLDRYSEVEKLYESIAKVVSDPRPAVESPTV